MSESLYFSLVFLAGLVGICTAAFAVFYRGRPGAKPLAVFAASASVWSVVEGLAVVQSGTETILFWTALSLSLSVVLPATWLVFVFEYTGNERWLTRRLYAALLVEPLLFVSLVWTNSSHELVWSGYTVVSYGAFDAFALVFEIGFWGHLAYSYLVLTVGAFVLLRLLFRTNRLYQWQGTALLVAIFVPMSASSLSSFGLLLPGIDPTGIASVLSAVILVVAVLETELRGVAPATREVGREAVLTELDDAIVILDDGNRVVDVNPAAERLLGESADSCLGKHLSALRPELERTLDGTEDQAQLELEREGKIRYYDIRVSGLYRGYGMVSGRVVSLRDVTRRRQREQRLDVLNRLLRHNIRNELNIARGKVELAQADIEDEKTRATLQDAITAVDGIVDRSNKLGRLSRMLDSEEMDAIDIATELRGEREMGGLSPEGGEVVFDLPDRLVVAGGSSLVAAFEELVSNAIEHNDSDEPRVHLRVNEGKTDETHVVIEISDNGPGIEDQELQTILSGEETPLRHSSGVGLWLVNWVVERAGGTVAFENDDGCTVRVRLPRAELDG